MWGAGWGRGAAWPCLFSALSYPIPFSSWLFALPEQAFFLFATLVRFGSVLGPVPFPCSSARGAGPVRALPLVSPPRPARPGPPAPASLARGLGLASEL